MENELEVEVTMCPYIYRAFVENVQSQGLEVSFENNWRTPCFIEFKYIRFPPEENHDDGISFKSNQSVEVYLKQPNIKNVFCWHSATLRDLNWNTGRWVAELTKPYEKKFVVIEVSIDDLRNVNTQPTLSRSTLEKVEIEIPAHLQKIAATDGIHDDFRKQVHADTCKYIPEKNILRLITKKGELTRVNVNYLKDSHINYLERQQKPAALPEKAKFSEVFEVDTKLMGLALGKHYANVKKARKIKDVTRVELIEGTQTICVCGKTAQAVKTAREMLEYREYRFEIPRYLAEEILEDDGKIIKEIVEQSGLVRIESGEDENEDDESEDYPVVFVGNPPCIENAKVLLEYQLKLAERELKKRQTAESESVHSNDSNHVIERIPMKKELRGLAIGKNYENVKKAKLIPGVVRITTPKNMPMITIYAEHEAAAQAARRLLEYDEDTIEVEQHSLGKIIGKHGTTIKKIESLSEGVRIHIPKVSPSSVPSGKIVITLCGPAHKIPATIELIRKAECSGNI